MAHTHPIGGRTLAHLARQIGQRLTPRGAAALSRSPGALELAESFELWSLPSRNILRPDALLQSIAHRTRRWHHQIRHDGQAAEYARSSPHGPGEEDWEVHAVVTSDLALKVDRAIAWIDDHLAEEGGLVRMLSIPAHLTLCFWIEHPEGDRVVVVETPRSYRHLVTKRLYSSTELLTALMQERPVAVLSRAAPA